MLQGDVITAAFATPLLASGAKAPKNVIQYLPKGRHEITAKVNGETATREVVVEAGVEKLFQEGLEAHQAENVTPFIDYLHENGRASGHPKQFAWDDQRGLTLEVDWTPNGSTAIASKELQFFSPEFLLSPEGLPLGLHPVNKAIGGLVSDPAFTSIESIAAKRAAKKQPTEPNTTNMDLTKFVELSVITAEQAKDPEKAMAIIADSVTASRSKDKDSAAQAALVKAEREKADALAEVKAMKEKAADDFVTAGIQAGRIKAKDEETISDLKEMHLANPVKAQRFLDRMAPTNGDLSKPVEKVTASAVGGDAEDDSDKPLLERAKELVQAGKAKNVSQAIRSIGSNAYQDHRTSIGLGQDAAELREKATQALMQAARG